MFREYDIRGRVSEQELNEESLRLIGQGFGTLLGRRGVRKAVVGFDSRECSERFRDALAAGLVSTGCEVTDTGMSLSPMLYFAQHTLAVPGGAMITGSHNPADWSGLKLSSAPSTTLLQPEVCELLDLIDRQDFMRGKGSVRKESIWDAYQQDLTSRVRLGRGLRVVIDAGNGTAGAFAPGIFEAVGCEVVPLYCDLDTAFPNHFPNPSDLASLRTLQQQVLARKADLGLAFDGDGDRLGVVDDEGRIVYADRVLMLLAREVLSRQPGAKIVFDVKCTQALVEDIVRHGGVPVMWKTGHSHIKAKMREEQAALAGERSGHIFFPPDWSSPDIHPAPAFYYGFDDAIFAGLRLMEFLSRQSKPLGELIAEVDPYLTSPEIHVPCSDTRKYELVSALLAEFQEEYDDVVDTNGARVALNGGWGLVRASSNLPELVLVFEARTVERLGEIKATFKRKLVAHGCRAPWEGDTDLPADSM